MWLFPKMVLPPNHPFLIGFSIINKPFWGTPIFGNTHVEPKKSPNWRGKSFSKPPLLCSIVPCWFSQGACFCGVWTDDKMLVCRGWGWVFLGGLKRQCCCTPRTSKYRGHSNNSPIFATNYTCFSSYLQGLYSFNFRNVSDRVVTDPITWFTWTINCSKWVSSLEVFGSYAPPTMSLTF